MLLLSDKFFPCCMIALSAAASLRYRFAGDIRHSLYWLASAVLISAVTF